MILREELKRRRRKTYLSLEMNESQKHIWKKCFQLPLLCMKFMFLEFLLGKIFFALMENQPMNNKNNLEFLFLVGQQIFLYCLLIFKMHLINFPSFNSFPLNHPKICKGIKQSIPTTFFIFSFKLKFTSCSSKLKSQIPTKLEEIMDMR